MIPDQLSNKKSADYEPVPIKPIPRQLFFSKFKQLSQVKYPIRALQQVEQLDNKIQTFKQKQVRQQLKTVLAQYNSYRQVRGDGNCFFRAIAFAYYSKLQSSKLNQCFPLLNTVDLTVCKKQSIPKSFRQFYDDRLLKYSLQQNWKSQLEYRAQRYFGNFNRAMARLLSDYPFLDFIIILYFRAVCLLAFQKNKNQLKDYLQGDQQNYIKTYGSQSQGVVLDICNRFFKINIEVFEIRKKEVKVYKYNRQKRPIAQVNLLYFENHYDLIQKNSQSQIKAERSQMKKIKEKQNQQNIQFFSQICSNMIQGQCIQCDKQGKIFQQNALCKACHQLSVNTLQNFAKDKLVKGRCAQCRYICDDVSQQFGLCKRCIKLQNSYTENQQYKKIYCQTCYHQIAQPGKCQRCLQKKKYKIDICVHCHYRQKVSVQLGLCDFCIRVHQRYADKFIPKKIAKCQKCNQQLKEGVHHQCKKECSGCFQRSYNLNKLDLCHKCSLNIKDDTVDSKIKKQATLKQKEKEQKNLQVSSNKSKQASKLIESKIQNSTCKICKKIVKKDPMVEDICQNCHDQKKLQRSQFKIKQQVNNVKNPAASSIAGMSKKQQQKDFKNCPKCGQQKKPSEFMDVICKNCKKNQNGQFQNYKKYDNQCKKCGRAVIKTYLKDGRCMQCLRLK